MKPFQLVYLKKQQGFTMVMVIIFLMLTLILAAVAVRSSVFQERMSGGTHDKNQSFQAAEAALAKAEACLAGAACADIKDTGDTTQPGFEERDYGQLQDWANFDWENRATPVNTTVQDVERKSYYYIEKMHAPIYVSGQAKETYRITAFGVGRTDNTSSIVQAFYTK